MFINNHLSKEAPREEVQYRIGRAQSNLFFRGHGPKGGHILLRKRVETTEAEILEVIRSLKGAKALTFEEGALSQWLYVLLKGEVDELVVANPVAIARSSAAKTDLLDATELADLLRVGWLKSVFHSADERMELRTMISGYEDLVQEIVRTKDRIKALFLNRMNRMENRME